MSIKDINLINRITINSDICHGKPIIRNLRYPVENIMELLSSGMSTEEILDDYEDLEKDDILACILYASNTIKTKDLFYFVPMVLKPNK